MEGRLIIVTELYIKLSRWAREVDTIAMSSTSLFRLLYYIAIAKTVYVIMFLERISLYFNAESKNQLLESI